LDDKFQHGSLAIFFGEQSDIFGRDSKQRNGQSIWIDFAMKRFNHPLELSVGVNFCHVCFWEHASGNQHLLMHCLNFIQVIGFLMEFRMKMFHLCGQSNRALCIDFTRCFLCVVSADW